MIDKVNEYRYVLQNKLTKKFFYFRNGVKTTACLWKAAQYDEVDTAEALRRIYCLGSDWVIIAVEVRIAQEVTVHD